MLEFLGFQIGMPSAAKSIATAAALGATYLGYLKYIDYNRPKAVISRRMREVFTLGDLGVKYGKDNVEYPSVYSIRLDRPVSRIGFTIPLGLNPDKVMNHKWLFGQQFGTDNVDLVRDVRRFTLTITL